MLKYNYILTSCIQNNNNNKYLVLDTELTDDHNSKNDIINLNLN